MKSSFIAAFLLALLAFIYLVFIREPAPKNSFRGPTNFPAVEGPKEPPPKK